MSIKRSIHARNAEANAVCALLNGGRLEIYSGRQPASPDDSVTTQRLLAKLTFADPAFREARKGTVQSEPLGEGRVLAEGKATWFRCVRVSGAVVLDGSIGTKDANLVLDRVELRAGMILEQVALSYSAT